MSPQDWTLSLIRAQALSKMIRVHATRNRAERRVT
jgi:hypothetical protein